MEGYYTNKKIDGLEKRISFLEKQNEKIVKVIKIHEKMIDGFIEAFTGKTK